MEKKVLSKRHKKASKGRVIRISDDVYGMLNKKRAQRKLSWDAFMRSHFNIVDREGQSPDLLEGWVVPGLHKIFPTKPVAHAEAVLMNVRKGSNGNVPRPIKVREVP